MKFPRGLLVLVQRNPGTALLLVVTAAGNVSNFLFNAMISRSLGPNLYGAFGALLGLLVVVSVPATAFQAALTRRLVQARLSSLDEDRVDLTSALLKAILAGVIGSAAVAGLAPVVATFLHLHSRQPVIVAALYVTPATVDLVPRAVLLAERRYGLLAVGTGSSAALRLVAGILLVRSGHGVGGAIAGSVVGEVGCAFILTSGLRGHLPLSALPSSRSIQVGREQAGALSALLGYWSLNGVDSFMARHFLSRSSSGLYSAASVTAQVATFLPNAIVPLMIARFAERHRSGEGAGRQLYATVAVVAGIALVAASSATIFRGRIVETLYGGQYSAASSILPQLALSAAFLAVLDVTIYFLIASTARSVAVVPWLGVISIPILATSLHRSPTALSIETVSSTAFVAAGALFLSARVVRDQGRPTSWSTTPRFSEE
jgi:O-antigen/teichoic acid export membrane protein